MELNYNGSGKINYKGKSYDCDLYLNNNLGGILLKIKVPSSFNSILKFPFTINRISGNLSNGFKFTIVNCKREKMIDDISRNQTNYTYICSYLINGIKCCKGMKFNKIVYSFSDIINWGRISGYKITEHECLVNNSDVKVTLINNCNFTINYFVSYNLIPYSDNYLMTESINLNQTGNIEILSKKGLQIEESEKLINKIIKIIEICNLKEIYIKEIYGESDKLYDNSGNSKFNIPINIYSYLINKEKGLNDSKSQIIYLTDLLSNNSFEFLFEKYDALEPILESYLEIIESKTTPIRKFLNLMESLETYHSRLICNNMEDFKKRINDVILKNRPDSFKEQDKKWLMANSRNFITLESRLADLLTANFNITFDTGEYDIRDYPNILAYTRHYYIHYDEEIKKEKNIIPINKLEIYNKSLFYILEYYIFNELGFDNVVDLRKILNNRWGTISTTLDLINKSSEME